MAPSEADLRLRFLVWPCRFTVAVVIVIAALAIPLLRQSIFGVPGLVILGSFISKYAYVLLESAANGVPEPPPLAAEMVNPFEQRPLIQLLIVALVASLVAWIRGPAGLAIAAAALLLLPASVGVLGVSGRLLDAANPTVLARSVVALGPWYAAILAATALYALVVTWAFSGAVWEITGWALLLYAVLSLYTLIGDAFHARRLQLGFEPVHSPEREAERAAAAHRRELDRLLEAVYGGIRLHDYERAGALLADWAQAADDAAALRDGPAFVQRALSWNDARGLALVASRVAARLLRGGSVGAALDAVGVALPRAPMLRLATDAEQFALAQAARADGRRALAMGLLKRFDADFPGSRLAERARALRAELS